MTELTLPVPKRRARALPVLVWPFLAAALLVALGAMISPGFASPDHLLLILNLAAFLGLVAMGQTLVILSGGIDLSVSSVVTITGVVCAALMDGSNAHFASAIVASCAVGLVAGLFNGAGVAYLKINPMVMTLGTTSIVQGIALLYTNGAPKGSSGPLLSRIATERMFGVVPYVLLVWAAISAVLIFLQHRTVWGRRLYALGNSPRAAFFSGVKVKPMLVSLYVASGLCSALAGVLLTGYTRTSYLNIGDPYQMNSITAVVIGGASILGGSGSYIGTIAGCILIVLIQSLLPIMAVPEAGRRIISGVLILALLLLYGRGRGRQ